jgi:Tol biopolymer transport system component
MAPLPIPADTSSAITLSPSSDKIAYTRVRKNTNIWAVRLNSNHAEPVARPLIASTATEENPQFSPDGEHIAYQFFAFGKSGDMGMRP